MQGQVTKLPTIFGFLPPVQKLSKNPEITYKLHLHAKVVPYIGIIIAKWIITGDLLALLGKLSHQTAKTVQKLMCQCIIRLS